jgi:UDP:flavonoid glycosyltransferase YjiC (YdhE family)
VRIALVAAGTRGDVHPMIELGARVRAAGHAARLCAPPDFAADAAQRGLEFRPIGESMREAIRIRSAVLTRGSWGAVAEGIRFFRECLDAQLAELPAAIAGCDRVVAAGVSLGAPTVADQLGLPYRYVLYCPVLLPSAEHPAPMLPLASLPRWMNRLSWVAMLSLLGRHLRRLVNPPRRRLGLPPVVDVYHHLLGPRPTLAADAVLAPAPRDTPFEIAQIPALGTGGGGPLPAKLESFLRAGTPPVYVGFGSMPDADARATTRLVLEAAARVGARVVIGSGWAGLGDVPLPESAMPVGDVPHGSLFARCAAVVHHGGAGTTSTATRAGVPQVLVPFAADQFYWGRRVELLGLGPPAVPRRRLAAQRLAEALAAVLDNEFVLGRTAEIGTRLRAEAALSDPVSTLLG